jgi:DNA helicase-2/ATP-dependent DNA helicase PcrA
MPIINIESNELIDIDTPFKVSAGPGAGKTYWLTQHIHNVVKRSDKLFISKKVLCITYTNNAVKTICSRLDNANSRVEVTTIHSFLYNHIVKPYVSVIANDFNLDISKIDGHDDTILTNYTFMQELFKRADVYVASQDISKVIDALKRAYWHFDSSNELVIKPNYPIKIGKYSLKNTTYTEYKKMAWEKGVLHHDDVLFFTYQILKKAPFVAEIISEKFPYIFIDEFQDCTPIQIFAFNEFAKFATVGVIGDYAQSIYGFQGANPDTFEEFSLARIRKYQITSNRRSSKEIINLLNEIRSDLQQTSIKELSELKPMILVGDVFQAYEYTRQHTENIMTLSRNNITSNLMKSGLNTSNFNDKLLVNLSAFDSNPIRSKLISTSITAVFLLNNSNFKDAIKTLQTNYSKNDLELEKKVLRYLTKLSESFETFKNLSLLDFSIFINDLADFSFPKVTRGKVKTFYEDHRFFDLYMCANSVNDNSQHITIHKSKGSEFDSVLLLMRELKELDVLIASDLNKEEQRISYVALSRAKNKLFINVPTMQESIRAKLLSIDSIEVVNL